MSYMKQGKNERKFLGFNTSHEELVRSISTLTRSRIESTISSKGVANFEG